MNDNQKEEDELEDDDFNAYIKEMEELQSDFSDLDDLDFEEIQEMKQAIEQVQKEQNNIIKEKTNTSSDSIQEKEYIEQKEALLDDFTDLEEIDFEELKEMREAIEEVKHDGIETKAIEEADSKISRKISSDLEERIKQELSKKKEEQKDQIITIEKFLEYVHDKRDKIWYHALWYILFNTEDQVASKEFLYDQLKEVTSKSPIDPIPEHQFYFGLGYLLRLKLEEEKIIRYMAGGKFKLNIGKKKIKDILERTGEPISRRPKIEESEKKKMFNDFLKDDFSDI